MGGRSQKHRLYFYIPLVAEGTGFPAIMFHGETFPRRRFFCGFFFVTVPGLNRITASPEGPASALDFHRADVGLLHFQRGDFSPNVHKLGAAEVERDPNASLN